MRNPLRRPRPDARPDRRALRRARIQAVNRQAWVEATAHRLR